MGGGLVKLVAPGGRGKTYWMMDMAYQAMLARNRVAFFIVGDMSQEEMEMRLQTRAIARPSLLGPYDYPLAITRTKGEQYATVTLDRRRPDAVFGPAEGWAALHAVQMNEVKSRDSYLKLSAHPSISITVDGLIAVLDGWSLDGFVPDCVVIDYPGNLAPPPGIKDKRDQINYNWQTLRGLAQRLHCLVLIADPSHSGRIYPQT